MSVYRLNVLTITKFLQVSQLNRFVGNSNLAKPFSSNIDHENGYFKNRSEEFLYQDEVLAQKRARLHWQSRKRGISETCLIFSTFSSKHLNSFSEQQVDIYDRLLNEPSNDWDVYYWMVGHKPVPKEYDSEIMKMLQEHCRNENKEERFEQPPLNYIPVEEVVEKHG